MIRPLTLFWFLIAATSVGMVFVISHEVTLRERQMNRLRVEVQKTRDRIHVLRAEWAYLGRPQYLEQLASQHLGLSPITSDRIIELADMPRPEERQKEDPALLAKATPKGKPGAALAAPAATVPAATKPVRLTAPPPVTAAAANPAPRAVPSAPFGNQAAPAPLPAASDILPAALPVRTATAPAAGVPRIGSVR